MNMMKLSRFFGCTLVVFLTIESVQAAKEEIVSKPEVYLKFWENILIDFDNRVEQITFTNVMQVDLYSDERYVKLREDINSYVAPSKGEEDSHLLKQVSYSLMLVAWVNSIEGKPLCELLCERSKRIPKCTALCDVLGRFLQNHFITDKYIQKAVLEFMKEQFERQLPKAWETVNNAPRAVLQFWRDTLKDFHQRASRIKIRSLSKDKYFHKFYPSDATFKERFDELDVHATVLCEKIDGTIEKDPDTGCYITGLNEAQENIKCKTEYSIKLIAYFFDAFKYWNLCGSICITSYPFKPIWSGPDGAETLKRALDDLLDDAEINDAMMRKTIIDSIRNKFEEQQCLNRVWKKWKRRMDAKKWGKVLAHCKTYKLSYRLHVAELS